MSLNKLRLNPNLIGINPNKFTQFLIVLCIAVFIFGLGYKTGEYKTFLQKKDRPSFSSLFREKNNPKNIDFSLFWDVWETVGKKFVDKTKLDDTAMYYGAIRGMVAALDDPYTFFLTPDENKESKADLEGVFEGIGAQLGMKEGRIVVIAPIKNSPAEKGGVLAGDIILKVDGAATDTWSLPLAVSKIRGEKGKAVKLTLFRNGKEFEVEIIRDEIQVASVEVAYEKDVAVLKLIKFGDDTIGEWSKAVNTISGKWKGREIKGLVLDMRDNPGGYLQGAVHIASEFVEGDKLIVKQEYTDGSSEEYTVNHRGKLLDIPLVVLINKGSASASEIVAGALRDYKRAKLIGEKSFGKGSIQEAVDLKGWAGLHVTIAKWILPKGDWINSTGVSPDITVKIPEDGENTTTRESDKQLEKALEEMVK